MLNIRIVCAVVFSSQILSAELNPWDLAYQSACQPPVSQCSESSLGASRKFVAYAQFDFLSKQDPRVQQQIELLKTLRRVPAPVPMPPQPMMTNEENADSRQRSIKRRPLRPVPNTKAIQALLSRAEVEMQEGRYDEAEKLISRSRKIDPASKETQKAWETLQEKMGR